MLPAPKLLVLLASFGLGLAVPGAALAQKPGKAAKKDKAAEEAPAADAKKGEGAAPEGKAPEGDVKAAGTSATEADKKKKGEPEVVKVEETEEGVKTYQFSAIEVEGRLKSPQIIYFLRRVRAEFEAGLLGHRSFLPELSDTRRSPSLR